MYTAARAWLRFLLAMGVALIASSVLMQFVLGTSYAGASDDNAVRTGLALYRDYVGRVVLLIAALLVAQAVLLSALSAGLLVFVHDRLGTKNNARAFGRLVVAATGIAVAATGAEAYRHPGLFLPIASSGLVGVAWVELGRLAWLMVLAGSAAGFAWASYRHSSRSRIVRWSAALAALVVLSSAWLSQSGSAAQPPRWSANGREATPTFRASTAPASERKFPNLLMVGVDSLRPDKIDPRLTPALASLLRESVYFPNALVTVPRTGPSWTALLTSLPPLENGIETMFPDAARSDLSKLGMPAHLASLGYRTAVFSEYAGEFFTRVRFGFEVVSVPEVELKQMLGQAILARFPGALALTSQLYTAGASARRQLPAPLVDLLRGTASFSHPQVLEDETVAWIDSLHGSPAPQPTSQPTSQPFPQPSPQPAPQPTRAPPSSGSPWFALVFFSQPHFPYTSSSAYHSRAAVKGADPALRFGKDVVRGDVRTAEDRAQVDALYRAALAETDAALASLLARLDAMHELADTLVVLTADHGEGLYECARCVGHGDNLAGLTTVRVPLAFRLPDTRFSSKPIRLDTYVSQLDVYPTILELLGVPVPPTHEGLALLDRHGTPTSNAVSSGERTFFVETGEWLWPSPAVPDDRILYPPITQIAKIEHDRVVIDDRFLPVVRAAKHRAAIMPPFALVYEPRRSKPVYRLSKLDEDPLGEVEVSAQYPERAAELREALRRSVLRFAPMLEVEGYFLTRPPTPPEEYW